MDQKTVDYIKKSRELGHSDSDIKAALLNAGHKEEDVHAAFDAADGKNVISLPVPPPPGFQSYGDSPIELPGPIGLLESAWQIYKDRFWNLLSLSILSTLYLTLYFGGLFLLPLLSWGTIFSILSPIVVALIFLLLLIPVVVISVKSVAALMFAVAAPRPISFSEAFRVSKGNVLQLLFIGILTGLVITGGFAMLLVPGIIFLAWFSLAQFVFVVEGHRGLNALLRSKEYVVGNRGKVFLRLLLMIIVSILIPLAIEFSIDPVSGIAAGITSSLFSSLFAPLSLAYIFSIYQALRARRPELVSRSVSGDKGLLIFSAIFGPIALIALYVALLLLNPSSLLVDEKDLKRGNDISTLSQTIALYQATTDTTLSCVPGKVYSSRDGTTAIDGTGWLPIDFTKMEYGPPIATLYTDPGDDPLYFYTYACDPDNNTYELNARPEGDKFKKIARDEDGGNNPDVYEVGSDLKLINK